MAQKPETKLKEKVLAAVRSLPNSVAYKIQQVAIRGTPDILACISGRFVALELKSSHKEAPDPLQEYTLQQIANADGIALVVNPQNWPDTYEALKKLAYGKTAPDVH